MLGVHTRFKASPDGVLWYHAHLGGVRADGAFGLFVVHKKPPTVPHYPLLINHWLHVPFYEFMIMNPYNKKNEGAIAGPGQLSYSFEHLHMEKPKVWQYGLWSFQTGGTKSERFLPRNQHTQRKLSNFENWVMGRCQKVPKFAFQRQFGMPQIIGIFFTFFFH